MDKQTILNKVLSEIVDSDLVNCCYTDETVMDERDPNINIYCITSREKLELFLKYQKSFLDKDLITIHTRIEKNCFSVYYEDGLIINIYNFIDINSCVKGKIYPLFDPNEMLINCKVQNYALTNAEYAKCFDDFSCALVDFYNATKKKDFIYSYKLSLNILDIFMLIYRGFYDSLNVKQQYKNTATTINPNFYKRLVAIVSNYKLESFVNGVMLSINEVEKIINVLPINVVTLFNFDFFNYAKKLIFSLNNK